MNVLYSRLRRHASRCGRRERGRRRRARKGGLNKYTLRMSDFDGILEGDLSIDANFDPCLFSLETLIDAFLKIKYAHIAYNIFLQFFSVHVIYIYSI
jgi:hypothetical protein